MEFIRNNSSSLGRLASEYIKIISAPKCLLRPCLWEMMMMFLSEGLFGHFKAFLRQRADPPRAGVSSGRLLLLPGGKIFRYPILAGHLTVKNISAEEDPSLQSQIFCPSIPEWNFLAVFYIIGFALNPGSL